ncbi:ABC transporter substrate-binding protein [Paenibacillus piri]|uniref:Carbohydrate ABC transporter substrate-binding protein n=1 Tax=Paenibacillus piri TaxID=2547395 RepID=A0A4R5KUA5_9BACL|nr:ABC transporter substrate-binding protein [Paenibacillus piri]TDF99499.1 carbohydrate ABC transporter substrate-binding protein [Paenibacillus piri]
MKKPGLVGLSLLLTGSFVLGCSSPQNSANSKGGENKADQPAKKIVVELWTLTGNPADAAEAVKKEFIKEHPNIEIKLSTRATDPHKEALRVAAASGKLPDMWYNWGGTLGSYYPENGFTLDLTEYAKKNNWDQKYLKSTLDLATLSGQLSGVPQHVRGMGIYYRKDIFEKYKLLEPKTFDDFEKILKTLKENGITPISTAGKGGWLTMRFMESLIEHYAGSSLNDGLKSFKESWDNPKVVAAYKKWKEWSDNGYFPKGFLTLDPTETKIAFYKATAAMVLENPTFDVTMNKDQQDLNLYGYFPFPTDQTPLRISSYVDMYQINKKSSPEVQEAAIQFAEFSVNPKTAEKLGSILNPPLASIGAPITSDMPHLKKFVQALEGGTYLITDQALPQEIIQKFFQAQDSIVTGDMTPERAAKFMQEEVEKYKVNKK